MTIRHAVLLGMLLPAATFAQPLIAPFPERPVVSLTSQASMPVDNDRMTIVLASEAENAQAAVAASEVNTRMDRALAVARGVANVSARTFSYTTNQVYEKGKLVRWRVSQQLQIETADFTAGATLATRLQGEGLLLSSLGFGVSPEARRRAVETLQREALADWQSRARQAASSMGYSGYVPGRLTIDANDSGPIPVPRFAAAAMAAAPPVPVAVSAGTSEVSLSVSGEAILTERQVPQNVR